MISRILYAAACVLVPVLWGLLVYKFSSKLEKSIRWLNPAPPAKPTTSDIIPDYHI